ncbi:MAG: ATP-binding cassette domain-containing protein [Anaerolineae bacterium]|nr:ATP-binding cassette domain-containing protein [Anaerolineae bacterium]
MIALSLDRVAVTYATLPTFTDISWEIHDNRVVGLVGPNGSGKSSLLKLISAEREPDQGRVIPRKGLRIGYLHQNPQLNPEHTVWQEALTASAELARIEAELSHVEAQLSRPAVYGNEKRLTHVLDRQEKLLAAYENLGGANYEGRVHSTLLQLGFAEADLSLSVNVLSGGQKKMVGLTKLLVNQPDLLLLDEPDNHLDLNGKAFLERFIRSFKGGVIIVSHDRYLLDEVADEIAEMEDGNLTLYKGNYTAYIAERELRRLRQQQMYAAQQKEIAGIEAAIARFELWASLVVNERHIRQARSRQKMLDRMEKIEAVTEQRTMRLELGGWRGSNKVVEIIELDKWFPASNNGDVVIVLAGLNLLIQRGERVGLVGKNGSGKSVLFRLLLGELEPSAGEIRIGPSVKTGYYAQEHEVLDGNMTLIDTIRHAATLSEGSAVSFLGRFQFTYEQCRSKVSTLSGGERSRLQLALLMLANVNFLLLDEPTNNLDIKSAEVLEAAIEEFDGTVLVISHDRYFLDRVVDRIVELEDGALTEYIGGYTDYQNAMQ